MDRPCFWPEGAVYCLCCQMWLNGAVQWQDHKIGQKHRKWRKKRPADPEGAPDDPVAWASAAEAAESRAAARAASAAEAAALVEALNAVPRTDELFCVSDEESDV